MRFDIISIFPEYFAPLDVSLLGKARRRGLVDVHVHDLRQWAHDRHRTVDDTPYGGGPGMVMKPGPWGEALDTIAPPPPPPPTPKREPSDAPSRERPPTQSSEAQPAEPRPAAAAPHEGIAPAGGSSGHQPAPPHPSEGESSGVPSYESGLPAGQSSEASEGPPTPPHPAAAAPYEGIAPAGGPYAGQPAPSQPPEGESSGVPSSESQFPTGQPYEGQARRAVDAPSEGVAPVGGSYEEQPAPSQPSEREPSGDRPYEGQVGGGGSAQASAGGPYGGAGGAEVPRLIVLTPSGRPFTQAMAVELAAEPWLIFACGRYEGIDSRVVEEARTRMRVDEVSIGDYVLAGGEVAALVMIEAISRLLPGVLGNADSVTDDSFAPGAMEALLEGPVYTKPPIWRDRAVPEVLLSGHHGAIARWRRDQALRRTAANRPELAAGLDPEALDKHDREVLRDAGSGPVPGDGEP